MLHDVLVIGGGAIGSSIAYFLRSHSAAPSVAVVEPDPLYELASTPRASGGVRRLFSLPENIELSKFGIEFFATFEQRVAVDDAPAAAIEWTPQGYLFIVPPPDVPVLEENFHRQQAHGVNVALLDRAGLARHFPSMRVDDLGAGVWSPDDGWLDPNGVLQGLRRKARALGADYVADRVTAISSAAGRAHAVTLASGTVIRAAAVVNAAGAWAAEICAMAGMPLPVTPMRRFEHYFETPASLEPLPYVKDPNRLAFRPEGRGYSGGVPDSDEPRGFNFDVDHGYFERVVWPALAHRFPCFEAVKCRNTWAGLYDQNEFDGNPVIGAWRGRLDNFYVAAGFSGHGLMHAPATGRAIAELIIDGGFQTIDLSRLGFERIENNTPYPERGII
jgi:glycine/D-amino acid oxidase-like deaminating enzyme